MCVHFYFRPTAGPLKALGRLHIAYRDTCKQFLFLGYGEFGASADSSHAEGPHHVLRLKSWLDWKALLHRAPGVIEDDYGSLYSVSEFESLVEAGLPDTAPGEPRAVGLSQQWTDPQGYRFSASLSG